jgi:phage portal protein BeeE
VNLFSKIVSRYSIDDFLQQVAFSYNGVPYIVGPGDGQYTDKKERPAEEFIGYVRSIYKANGPVFACIALRLLVFSEARFMWQQMNNGRSGDLFGNRDLAILERPWPNGTTGELLARMEQDTSLAGNFYAVNEGDRLRRLRPDWVTIILSAPVGEATKSDVVGYMYQPGGPNSKSKAELFQIDEVAHWSPIPDPENQYKGMSWITPIVKDVMADKSAVEHELSFFDNAATPQLAVTIPDGVTKEEFEEFVEKAELKHRGGANAYRTMYLGGGADVHVVGKDLQQIQFTEARAAGEVRIAAAARVPPSLVGFSEGLRGSALNAGNFSSARRAFGETTMRPLWRSACAALEPIMRRPNSNTRLWYDDRDISFLREDAKEAAEVQTAMVTSIGALVQAGYEPDAVVKAVQASDLSLLVGKHTGLFSVQLQPPGNGMDPDGDQTPTADPTGDGSGDSGDNEAPTES